MKAQPIPGRYFNRQPEVSEKMSCEQFQILHISPILDKITQTFIEGVSQNLRLITGRFPTLSSHFFCQLHEYLLQK